MERLSSPLTPSGSTAALRAFAVGQIVAGRYQIRRFIAEGGMGEVYEAEHLELGQRVALKTIRPELAASRDNLERFRREILLARQVTHASVCRVFDIEHHTPTGGSPIPFLTMELLDGETLAAFVARKAPLDLDQVRSLARQLGEALHAAHEAGVVHRDFKSSNVLLVSSARGLRAVVTDFGIAGLSMAEPEPRGGVILGTPAYMAPEQAAGGDVTSAADIYAFGVVLFEMVTGQRPVAGRSADSLNLVGLPPAWETAILRCLQRAPGDRFADARDVVAALDAEQGARRRSTRRLMTGAVLVVVALGAVVFTAARPSGGANVAVTPAQRPSIAVLGFKNLSDRPDAAWLSGAFAELLGTELTAGERLRLVPGENVARVKLELRLADADGFASETLARLHGNLEAELVLAGSYLMIGSKIRLDLHVQDTASGETLARLSEEASSDDVLEIVTRLGARLRDKLGVAALSDDELGGLRAARPRSAEAARLYADGLARLRSADVRAARDLLAHAVTADPGFPLAHLALSEAWAALGYDGKSLAEAREAFDVSESLARAGRLEVEGRYRWAMKDWDRAIAIHQRLELLFPDELEHGLRLAEVQTAAGKARDALRTVATLRAHLPGARQDPRVDLAEAAAFAALSDFRGQLLAAEHAVAQAEAAEARLLLGQARLAEWWARRNLGELERAATAAREARRIFAEAGDRPGAARALNSLATVLSDLGDVDAAYAMDLEAMTIFREIGDEKRVAWSLNNVARVLRSRGRLAEARVRYQESLEICRRIDDKAGLGRALANTGLVLWEEGRLPEARAALEEGLAVRREIGEQRGVAGTKASLAFVLWREGRLTEALALGTEARDQLLNLGDRQSASILTAFLGDVLLDEDRVAEARRAQEEALALRRELGLKRMITGSRLALAGLTLVEGRAAEAGRLVRALVQDPPAPLNATEEALAASLLARAALAAGDRTGAGVAAARALALAESSEYTADRLGVAIAACRVRAASASGRELEALVARIAQAEARASELGLVGIALEARLARGEVELLRGEGQARAELAALAVEAATHGFARIARRAAANRPPEPRSARAPRER